MIHWIRRRIAHPITRSLDLNDPRMTELRRDLIFSKPFLLRVYREWYHWIFERLPVLEGEVIELGAGAGFLKEILGSVFSTELFFCPGLSAVADAQFLPFAQGSLRAVVFTNVLHHLPRTRQFFREAARCTKPGGRIIMIEPWVSSWSRLIYLRLHHERFDPEAQTWEFFTSGPLSGSNQALPWIIFVRDRAVFEKEFSEWHIVEIQPLMPLCYLVSGGLTTRDWMPAWSYNFWSWVEKFFPSAAMFACVTLERNRE